MAGALRRADPVDVLRSELAGTDEPRVAVLVGGGTSELARRVHRRLPGVRLTKVAVAKRRRLSLRLAAAGPFDAIVDATRRPGSRGRLFRRVFGHLRPGGVYLAVGHVHQESAFGSAPPPGSLGATLRGSLPAAVRQVEHRDGHLVAVNGAATLAKVAEKQANRLLRLRGGSDRVLQTLPGMDFDSRCELLCSGERPGNMAPVITAPPLSLREYAGAVCVPGQVLVSGHLLLPDTYRHNQRSRLTNMHTSNLGRRFASVEADLDAAPSLEGTYFYLDNEVRGHFGHALTEQVSLLWALAAARQHAGHVKAIMSVNRRRELQPFEVELFRAAGLGTEDIVVLEEPARVEQLLAATPALSMPDYVHPVISGAWRELGDALAQRATREHGHDRIFVGRRTHRRACLNAVEVEALFTARGFTVVYPEDYSLADQVALFRSARVIGGYAGSGLFQMAFVPEPRTFVQIRAETYGPTNEYLIASVLGHRLVSVVGRAERTEDEERRNAKRYQSSFRIDLDKEGRFLREVLDQL